MVLLNASAAEVSVPELTTASPFLHSLFDVTFNDHFESSSPMHNKRNTKPLKKEKKLKILKGSFFRGSVKQNCVAIINQTLRSLSHDKHIIIK